MEPTELDPRLLRVSVQIRGQMKQYDTLAIKARGCKYANANQNECEIEITNLDRITHDYLITETSPFIKNFKPIPITLEAGRKSIGYSMVFSGGITTACGKQPPDIEMRLKVATGEFHRGQIISAAKSGPTSLSNIARGVAGSLGVGLKFEATDKQISNYSFSGAALKQVDKLGEMGSVNAFIDDQILVVKNFNKALRNRVRDLNLDTGMIGIPEFTEQGIKVKMLFDNQTVCGGGLKITSKLNPAANGVYVIYKLEFELANRDVPFYYIANCVRVGDS